MSEEPKGTEYPINLIIKCPLCLERLPFNFRSYMTDYSLVCPSCNRSLKIRLEIREDLAPRDVFNPTEEEIFKLIKSWTEKINKSLSDVQLYSDYIKGLFESLNKKKGD